MQWFPCRSSRSNCSSRSGRRRGCISSTILSRSTSTSKVIAALLAVDYTRPLTSSSLTVSYRRPLTLSDLDDSQRRKDLRSVDDPNAAEDSVNRKTIHWGRLPSVRSIRSFGWLGWRIGTSEDCVLLYVLPVLTTASDVGRWLSCKTKLDKPSPLTRYLSFPMLSIFDQRDSLCRHRCQAESKGSKDGSLSRALLPDVPVEEPRVPVPTPYVLPSMWDLVCDGALSEVMS